mgnify:CR=1 FL=1
MHSRQHTKAVKVGRRRLEEKKDTKIRREKEGRMRTRFTPHALRLSSEHASIPTVDRSGRRVFRNDSEKIAERIIALTEKVVA